MRPDWRYRGGGARSEGAAGAVARIAGVPKGSAAAVQTRYEKPGVLGTGHQSRWRGPIDEAPPAHAADVTGGAYII